MTRVLWGNGGPVIRGGKFLTIPGNVDDCLCCCPPGACCEKTGEWICSEASTWEKPKMPLGSMVSVSGVADYSRIWTRVGHDICLFWPNECDIYAIDEYDETYVTGLTALNGTYNAALYDSPASDAPCTGEQNPHPPASCEGMLHDACAWRLNVPPVPVTIYNKWRISTQCDGTTSAGEQNGSGWAKLHLSDTGQAALSIYSSVNLYRRGFSIFELGFSDNHIEFGGNATYDPAFPPPPTWWPGWIEDLPQCSSPGGVLPPASFYLPGDTTVLEQFGPRRVQGSCQHVPGWHQSWIEQQTHSGMSVEVSAQELFWSEAA